MPSPNHKARASNTSLPRASSLKSTGAAIRRGDLHISDPIPVSQDGLAAIVPQLGPDSPQVQATVLQRDDSLPPRRYPPQEKNGLYASYALAESKPATRYNAPTQFHDPHESMSSGPSKGSVRRPKKEGGFRATMRKIFGTKKGRSPLSNISGDHHRSVSMARPLDSDYCTDLNRLLSLSTTYRSLEILPDLPCRFLKSHGLAPSDHTLPLRHSMMPGALQRAMMKRGPPFKKTWIHTGAAIPFPALSLLQEKRELWLLL